MNGVLILTVINETLGRVLAICGINGIYVTEKPSYMFPLYVLYICMMVLFGTVLTVLLKQIVEKIAVKLS